MPYKDREQQLEAQRQHYRDNKEKYLQRKKEVKKQTAELIRRVKAVPCADCGVQYPYYVMQFDHLRDKKFGVANYGSRCEQTILDEIAKCEVVCANCHAERTFRRA